MTVFEYTHTLEPEESEYVWQIAYNENTNELLADLKGVQYLYSHVPHSAYNRLVNAEATLNSVGAEFRRIMRDFGPASRGTFYAQPAPEPNPVPETVKGAETYPLSIPSTQTNATIAGESAEVYTLKVGSAPVVKPLHTLYFTVGDSVDVRHYDVRDAANVDEAVRELNKVAEALDLDFHVKGVYVSFE